MTRYGLRLRKRSMRSKSVNITEFTVYDDLVLHSANTRLKELGVTDTTIYKEAPCKCEKCKSTTIVSVEVLGALDEPLFWMCNDCETIFLKFDNDRTERLLEQSSKCWTNTHDWDIYMKETN
jgi:hypothetical protein